MSTTTNSKSSLNFDQGQTFEVNPSSEDIVGFDPRQDRLDFADISVHGLILG